MEVNKHSGTAFPPFHAKFFADKYLPKNSEGIIVDPCAGWGGRLIGSLLVNRAYPVRYYGIDPAIENKEAYDGLKRRVNIWLKKELTGPRDAIISYKPFEDWIASDLPLKFHPAAIRNRAVVRLAAWVKQRAIGGAGRGCVAERPLR